MTVSRAPVRTRCIQVMFHLSTSHQTELSLISCLCCMMDSMRICPKCLLPVIFNFSKIQADIYVTGWGGVGWGLSSGRRAAGVQAGATCAGHERIRVLVAQLDMMPFEDALQRLHTPIDKTECKPMQQPCPQPCQCTTCTLYHCRMCSVELFSITRLGSLPCCS